MESRCRICNQYGHWKAERPQRGNATTGSDRPPQVPTSFVQSSSAADPSSLPLEFLQLPEHASTLDDSRVATCLVTGVDNINPRTNQGYNGGLSRQPSSHSKLSDSLERWNSRNGRLSAPSLPRTEKIPLCLGNPLNSEAGLTVRPDPPKLDSPTDVAVTCFATHGSLGVVDLGATKTVIGSDNVQGLLDNLDPQIKKIIYRCPCKITFRFGNHGILQSDVAMVVPIHGFHLKIAIVPGSTPFLLSNTLLRALESIIDTNQKTLFSKKLDMSFPLQLTSKGLFLLDLNDLASVKPSTTPEECIAETNVVVEPKTALRPCSTNCPGGTQHGSLKIEDQDHTQGMQLDKERAQKTPMVDNPDENDHDEVNNTSDQVQGDTQFARSFRIPNRSSHHGIGETSSAGPNQGQRALAGFQQDVPGRTGERTNNVRNGSQGPIVPRGMALGPSLGPVVYPTLRSVEEGFPPSISAFRGIDGKESGTDPGSSPRLRAQQACPSDLRGQWEAIPQEQVHGQAFKPSSGVGRDRRGRHSQPVRHASRVQDAQSRERVVPSHPSFGKLGTTASSSQKESEAISEDQLLLGAGEISPDREINPDSEESTIPTERCHEGQVFRKLLRQYCKEYEEILQKHLCQKTNSKAKLFEVFCGPNSQLSHQCQRLGFKSVRFGTEQCDLQTFEGRRFLFEQLMIHQPDHLWFSPTCGPWSSWSRLNETKSPELWKCIQEQRLKGLEQIALGTVLLRHQRDHEKHFHWEQPQSSLMLRLPYLNEVYYHHLLK